MPEFLTKVYLDHFKLKNKAEVAKCIKETPLDSSDDENPFDTKKVKRKAANKKAVQKKYSER